MVVAQKMKPTFDDPQYTIMDTSNLFDHPYVNRERAVVAVRFLAHLLWQMDYLN